MRDWMRKWGLTGLCAVMAATMVPSAALAAPGELSAVGAAAAVSGNAGEQTIAPVGAASLPGLEDDTPEEAEAPAEHAAVAAYEARKAEAEEAYQNVAISQVSNYVNIRTDASTDAEVLGKIYNNAAATILETVEKEDGTWYRIQSGSVEGYIKAEYFVTGAEAEALAREVGRVSATVTTETLRLRAEPSLDSQMLDLLSMDEEYAIVEENGNFVKLAVDTDLTGYVSKDYVDINIEFDQAISLEEERAEQERLAQLQREAEEEAERLERERQEEEEDRSSGSSSSNRGSSSSSSSSSSRYDEEEEEEEDDWEAPSSSGSVSSTRSAIAAYAESFVGNLDYVYGGNSLSSGVDCSGFVQQIFAHYGVSLPRTSGEQGSSGRSISSGDMEPGDIIYYGGHVAIYIGGGQVVHASSPETGVKISSWNYRTPKSIRNVLD